MVTGRRGLQGLGVCVGAGGGGGVVRREGRRESGGLTEKRALLGMVLMERVHTLC